MNMSLNNFKIKKVIFNTLLALLFIYFISNMFLKMEYKFPYLVSLVLLLWYALVKHTDKVKPGTLLWKLKVFLAFKPLNTKTH